MVRDIKENFRSEVILAVALGGKHFGAFFSEPAK